ncbi:MAG: acyloxyacyl hydrolase [Verrucomicrobiota bacterium]
MRTLNKLTLITGLLLLNIAFLQAEDAACPDAEKSSAQVMAEKTEKTDDTKDAVKNPHYGENVVNVAFESWHLLSVGHEHNYYVAPQMISVIWQLDDVGLDGWLRGNTAWTFSALYSPVFTGPENRMIGTCWGPRYNFVQPGWDIVPYAESRLGILFTDSTGVADAQGQDFCFQFMVSIGMQYYFDESWSVQLSANYQHISNSGLSEPEHKNVGLDIIGPGVAVLYQF